MSQLSDALLRFHQENPRNLPWRKDPSPYHVWVSEIMLQQTRVETVKGYFERFMACLPDVAALARSNEDLCLKLWEGLGYYSRVRNLRKAAMEIVKKHRGEIPCEVSDLKRLPGIGEYTASAIAAIAFHAKEVAVDGNLVRIYARLFARPLDPGSPKDRRLVALGFAEQMDIDPAIFNETLMDIGQLQCLPNGKPLCSTCPLRGFCIAHQREEEQKYPLAKKKTKRKTEERTILILTKQNRVYLEKRPEEGLLSSLYQPMNLLGRWKEEGIRDYLEKKGYVLGSFENLGGAKHIFSHVEWHMTGWKIEVLASPKDALFVTQYEKETEYSVPSAFNAFLG